MSSGPVGGKKEAPCDADDKERGLGDGWDHDLLDVASGAGSVRVQGPRTAATVQSALVALKERVAPGHVPGLVTTDEHSPSVAALLTVFGQRHPPDRGPGPGAPQKAVLVPAPEVVYAQVDKQRAATGRGETLEPRLSFGTPEQVAQRLAASPASTAVDTAFSERAHGCDRHRNSRKARQVLSFSQQGAEPRAVAWRVRGLGLFCWVPRTLRQTPALRLGKATHVLPIGEFLRLRPQGFRPPTWADLRAGNTSFHRPAVPSKRLAQWPNKRLVQRSFKHLGVNARGLG